MLADEVTHVKMGSDWLRRLTANDPERQKNALEFQKAVDKLFSFGGFRGETRREPGAPGPQLPPLAGFSDDEIAELVDIAAEAYAEAAGQSAGRVRRRSCGRLTELEARPGRRIRASTTSTRTGRGSSSSATAWPASGRSARTGSRAAHPRAVVVHRHRRADDVRPGRARRHPGQQVQVRRSRSSTPSTASSAIIAVAIIYATAPS